MDRTIRQHGPDGYRFVREAKERQVRDKQEKMIADYCEFLEHRPSGSVHSVRLLPHPKNKLVEAFLNVIANSKSELEINHAALSIMTLASFQRGVKPEKSLMIPDVQHDANGDLSPEDVDAFLDQIDLKETTRLIGLHAADVSEFRQWILKAMALNPHLLPWYVKLWHRFREKGAYGWMADEFVVIQYP